MYKVLIVEDEKVIADTLAAHLNKWGYEAVCVTDFQNVLEEFEREKPHIVLMDIGQRLRELLLLTLRLFWQMSPQERWIQSLQTSF